MFPEEEGQNGCSQLGEEDEEDEHEELNEEEKRSQRSCREVVYSPFHSTPLGGTVVLFYFSAT